jgi:hypothetical protein
MTVRLTQLAEDGSETASIEVDDFTIAVIYSGLAEMLREAASSSTRSPASVPACELSREARQRRQRVLSRLHD